MESNLATAIAACVRHGSGVLAAPNLEPFGTPEDPRALDELLRRRSSVRRYSSRPIEAAQLGSALSAASTADERYRNAVDSNLPPLSIYVVAERVAGLSPGLHEFGGVGGGTQATAARWWTVHSDRNRLGDWLELGDETDNAAAFALLCRKASARSAQDQPYDTYCHDLIGGAFTAYALWLNLMQLGLAACPLGGPRSQWFASDVCEPGESLLHVLSLAVGIAESAASPVAWRAQPPENE